MTKDRQKQLADAFRAMHRGPLLLLANAWDAMSARQFEAAGFGAVATTSGGVAWDLGYRRRREGALGRGGRGHARGSCARCGCRSPPTSRPATARRRTRSERASPRSSRTGAVGFNLEDGTPRADMPVRPIEDAAARIRAARAAATAAGVPTVINARIDLYLKNVGDPASRFDETVKRAKAYLAAGADCIYPFGFIDLDTVARLVKAIGAPVNIVARAGTPPAAELEKIGVARVSIASGATLAVMSLIKKIGEELRATGKFDGLEHSMNRPEAQKLFEPRD